MTKLLFAGIAISVGIGAAAQADLLYGTDINDGSIFTLDTTNGAIQKFFGHDAFGFGGLDWDSGGQLYLEQFGSLFKIDLGVSSTEVGSDSGRAFESFEILGDTAYATDVFDGALYTVDLSNNNTTFVGTFGDESTPITALASNEANTLYGALFSQGEIVSVNPADGQITGTIATGLPANVTSLALGSNNNLWFIPAFETTLYSVDISTGQVTQVLFNLNVSHVSGLTSRIPAPGAAALVGVAGLIARRRR
jgi:hypothetical protein